MADVVELSASSYLYHPPRHTNFGALPAAFIPSRQPARIGARIAAAIEMCRGLLRPIVGPRLVGADGRNHNPVHFEQVADVISEDIIVACPKLRK